MRRDDVRRERGAMCIETSTHIKADLAITV